jgi:demethylmenaquinone methyltransferase/2-methoxy-6-polyprenyl-1,4-benzoquinol methylase
MKDCGKITLNVCKLRGLTANPRKNFEVMRKTTHFGFQIVNEDEKTRRVGDVFESVASRYDLMNDLMSGGLHRLWKRFAVELSGVRPGYRVLDIAGGTADLSRLFAKRIGTTGEIVLSDINAAMLAMGRDRLINAGVVVPAVQCDAERLPFHSDHFDCVSVAFGLRNMTRQEAALAEMMRVLRPGGRLLILEFSRIWKPLKPLYDVYSLKLLPLLGKFVTRDAASYRYLAESIRVHPDQETLKRMIEKVGGVDVEYFNLSAGIVALHRARKS